MHTILNLIADTATQPSGWAAWTPAEVVTLIGALAAAVLSVIAALKGTAANAKADAAHMSLDRFSSRANAADTRISAIERDMPPANRPATPPQPATPFNPNPPRTFPFALLPLLILPLLTGCAFFNPKATQEDKVAAVEKTFTSTVTALTQLRADGKLSDTEWARSKQIAEGIDAAFDALHDDIDAGKKVDVDTVLKGIRASLDRLNTYKSEARRERSDASTSAGAARFAGDVGQERVYRRAA
jgi:hypothetical protein